jgi:hypothetical protein
MRIIEDGIATLPEWLRPRMEEIVDGARKVARGAAGTPVVAAATTAEQAHSTLILACEEALDELLQGQQRDRVREALPPGWLWLAVVTEEGTGLLACGPTARGGAA